MRYVISCMLCLSLLLTAPLCHAGNKSVSTSKDAQEQIHIPAVTKQANPPVPVEHISQIRWSPQSNADTNDSWLRLVMDVTGPVLAEGTIIHTPAPYLAVRIKGAIPGDIARSLKLDGQMAAGLSISTEGQNSLLLIELITGADDSNCRMFTLPPEEGANKPYRLIIDISTPAPPPAFSFTPGLKDKVIVLDPGHGGSDAGAIGPGQTMEKTITLAVARDIKSLLEKAGAKVLLTRQEDRDVFCAQAADRDELEARVAVANHAKADLFLSIHANASINPLANGTSTYYFKKTSYDAMLAQNIQRSMVQAGGRRDRSFFPANFYVVKHSEMPAVLIELAFISNSAEETLLNDAQFRQKMAHGIVEGIDHFFAQVSKKH